MADDIVIHAEGLGKKYVIGHETERERYTALRDVIGRRAKALLRTTSDMLRGRAIVAGDKTEEIWALKDISFEVKRGEVLGIIGRNGAGKSTLLKILSRITEPTDGRVEIRGRVASLLEVGTGFHPELTGRENIYLNGAILGMPRAEIKRKFDEIVDFSGVEQFLDTPVKRYSSGMYVRLAFAVAAHLEPEILVVDEVLAVGDAEFQKKCLGKMSEVAGGGRTVLFVSHNMGAVQTLCSRAVLLEGGRTAFNGIAQEAVRTYSVNRISECDVQDSVKWVRQGTGEARVMSVRLEDGEGKPQTTFRMGEPLLIIVRVELFNEVQNPTFGFNIVTDSGIRVADCRSSHYGLRSGRLHGIIEYRARVASLQLYPRGYLIEPWIADASCISDYDWVRNAVEFQVTSGPNFLNGANVNGNHGIAFVPTSWDFSALRS